MANQTLHDGIRNVIVKHTFVSGGADETSAVMIDVSALRNDGRGNACSEVKINKIKGSTEGCSADLVWDATTDVLCHTIPPDTDFEYDYRDMGGLTNNAGSGVTGDLLVTSHNATSGDQLTIVVEAVKKYG